MVCPLNNFLERLIFSWKEGSHKFGSRAAGCFKVALTEKEEGDHARLVACPACPLTD